MVRKEDGIYLADIDTAGDITATHILIHNNGMRTAEEIEFIKSQNVNAFFNAAKEENEIRRRVQIAVKEETSSAYTPHMGSPKIVVILTEFQDVKFTINEPKKAFDQYFNTKGKFKNYNNRDTLNHSSVAQYFSDMSSGAFTPQFEVVGPVTAPNSMAYYSGSGLARTDEKPTELVKEAINLVQEKGLVNLSKAEYDLNNDNQIDMVYVIHAGYMRNYGENYSSSIWPRTKSTNIPIDDVKSVRKYCISGERFSTTRIAPIGVACHEFSHALGLPDLYSEDKKYFNDNQQMEFWDLMDGGENVSSGYTPVAYTAWEKEAMGWNVDYEDLKDEDLLHADFSIPTQDYGKAYRIVNPKDEEEFIILENIQRTGWNGKIFVKNNTTGGILAYHMKYPSKTVNSNDYPNARLDPSIAVIPADGLVESYDFINSTKDGVERTENSYYDSLRGDLFNLENGTELYDDLNLPNFCWYTGDKSDLIQGYTNRYRINKYVSFEFYGDKIWLNYITDMSTVGIRENKIETDSKAYYSIDGQYLGTDKGKLKPGIYISNKKKVIIR